MAPVHDARTSHSTAGISHRYRPCFKNEDLPPSIKKLSAGATMHSYHRCKANMPSIRLTLTVLGRVLMVEAGVYDVYAHLRASCHQWLICILLQKLELVAAALPSPHATILKIKLP